jgi:microsomal dipeptidase-like Zn-dependent dipeptidase
MREGGVGVALSVLILPLLEMGERLTIAYRRRPPFGAPPADHYLPALHRQLELVERRAAELHPQIVAVARSPEELDSGLAKGKLVLVHCVEGGFHLGSTPGAAERAVAELARRGVAYITLAHLYWRHVATNAPAVRFMSDRLYQRIFPQPEVGLSELGRAVVRAMVRERVLIDLSHMSARALDDTFTLLDELDPERTVPVIASHVAFRFGRRTYNLDEHTIEQIAARGGLIGLILAEREVTDGLRPYRTHSFEEAFDVLARHVDRIRVLTGSHRHTAIGSDLDGFIKPTLAGLGDAAQLASLEQALRKRYSDDADLIAAGNALRLLRSYWCGAPGPDPHTRPNARSSSPDATLDGRAQPAASTRH